MGSENTRIIVLGGSGFVGRHFIKLHREIIDKAKNDELDSLQFMSKKDIDNAKNHLTETLIVNIDTNDMHTEMARDAHLIKMDLMSYRFREFEFRDTDIVIHLAARMMNEKITRGNEEKYFRFNIDIMDKIINKMMKHGARKLIYFSTDMVYGRPQYLPIDTEHPTNPIGEYGRSKLKSEMLIKHCKDINATIFRPRMIMGAGRLGILTKLFRLIELNLPVPIIGDGQNCYQMVSVWDCSRAIVKSILHKQNLEIPRDVINLGSMNPPTVKHLLRSLIAKQKSKSFLMPMHSGITKRMLRMLENINMPLMYAEQYEIANEQYVVDMQKCKDILDWVPQDNDVDMINSAFEEYKRLKRI